MTNQSWSSFLVTCFDPDVDKTKASINGFTIALSTGDRVDMPSGQSVVASKFLAEGVLLFLTNYCEALGFVEGTNERTVMAVWRSPLTNSAFWATLDLDTSTLKTNAVNNFARQGVGLIGMLVALKYRPDEFRSSWMSLLSDMSELDASNINANNIGQVTGSIVLAYQEMARGIDAGRGEVLAVSTSTPGYGHVDMRHQFVTVDEFMALTDRMHAPEEATLSRFHGPQMALLRGLMQRRKHTVLLGPPGVGKTLSAFEALKAEGYERPGVDYQLFSGHDEVKSSDFLGSWQPSGDPSRPFTWVNGCLVRAMTANDGRGQPLLVEEFTRMPTRAQNMFITALSDGYVVLNEKHDPSGVGETVWAGPDFVLIADMNVDPSSDDIDMFGAAFSSRVRKIEYEYPSMATMLHILSQQVPEAGPTLRKAVAAVYDVVLKRWQGAELPSPISPRACVQWTEEICAALQAVQLKAAGAGEETQAVEVRSAAFQGASLTWLRDVAGTDQKLRKTLMNDIEAHCRKAMNVRRPTKTTAKPGKTA